MYCAQLVNTDNYGLYNKGLIKNGKQTIHTADITHDTYWEYFNCLMNIFRDGIESEEVEKMFVTIVFDDNQKVELNIMDFYFNLIMWRCILDLGMQIKARNLFFPEDITQADIKKFIDNEFLIKYRDEDNVLYNRGYNPEMANIILNQCIDNTVYEFGFIDEFSMFLMNTINLEDDIELWKQNPRFYELLHPDMNVVPIEQVKDYGLKLEREAAAIIKDSDHCLADSFRAKQGINPKQYKEFAINIGTKPDGLGSVYPTIVNTSFINGGVNTLESFFIESSSGRLAQIIAKCNVGTAGAFARILGLNNRDTRIHPNPRYVCDSKHFEQIYMKDASYLYSFEGRYYRTHPLGMEKCLTTKDTDLIGKVLYFRSPMKCASAARGQGICYRCYGKLAYTNSSINIGQYAADALSAPLTQKQLSAKHLLESSVISLEWCDELQSYFEVEFNALMLKLDMDYTGFKLVIDPKDIQLESEEDDYAYNEFVNSFKVIDPAGNEHPIYTKNSDPIYFSADLSEAISRLRRRAIEGNMISIPLDAYDSSCPVFMINLVNNEFSATLQRVKSIINLKSVTTSFDTHQLLQEFNEAVKDGGLGVVSVHLEVILMNQLRSVKDPLLTPDWTLGNETCEIFTLNRALNENPSITVSLMNSIGNVYYAPISFRKNKPSLLDLLFMEKPQLLFQNEGLYRAPEAKPYEKQPIDLVRWSNKED